MENYQTICQIGKGACGDVFLVRSKDSKKLLALKRIELDESRKTRTKDAVQREARILSELKHPHIVSFHESFFNEGEKHLCIIQDYCDGGTLEEKLKEAIAKNEYLPEKQIIQWFLQIAMAVRYMHSKKVLHRDLKASNVFLNKSGTLCKIGDFGIAKAMDTIEVASTCVGTPCYLSPEMCQDIPYSSKADIWALGCMLYEMCALKPAFDAHNLVSLFYKIVKADFEPIPAIYSNKMHELIGAVLDKAPDDRPSARGVLALPYVKEELLKFIEEKEFLLQQIRVPTRQGSRPYSTPTLSRVDPNSAPVTPRNTNVDPAATQPLPSEVKRAISSRPVLVPSQRENGILMSARTGRNRRSNVSTIVEENEDLPAVVERPAVDRAMNMDKLMHSPVSLTKSKDGLASLEDKKSQGSLTPKTPRKADQKQKSSRNHDTKDEKPSKLAKVEDSKSRSKSQERGELSKDSTESGKKGSKSKESKKDRPQSAKEKARVKSDDKEQKRPVSAKQLATKKDKKLPALSDGDNSNNKTDSYEGNIINNNKKQKKSSKTPDLRPKTPNGVIQAPRHGEGKQIVPPGMAAVHVGIASPASSSKPFRLPELDLAQSLNLPQFAAKDAMLSEEMLLSNSLNLTSRRDKNNQSIGSSGYGSGFHTPGGGTSLRDVRDVFSPTNSPRKGKIAEPTRTPRNLVSNSLLIQVERVKSPPVGVSADFGTGTPPKTLPPVIPQIKHTVTTSSTMASTTTSSTHKEAKKKDKNKKGSQKMSETTSREKETRAAPPSRGSTNLSVPTEHIDYYSDDFEDSSIEEEIPEDIPHKSKGSAKMARSYSFTQVLAMEPPDAEIPEIPEDLPDGASELDDDEIETDAEEIEEEEYLDEVVMVAREFHKELTKRDSEDEIIVDTRPRSNTRQMITKHCMDTLGREKYETIRTVCENNHNNTNGKHAELKSLEKSVGRENMKMVYLMNEVFNPNSANNRH